MNNVITSRDGANIAGPTADRPTNATIGQTYFDSDTGEQLVCNGTGWGPAGGAVDHSFSYNAPADGILFVANRAYTVKAIRVRPLVAGTDAGAVTAVVKKAASGTAITAGTALHTGTADLKGTINANQTLTLAALAATLAIAAGDAIGIDVTGVATAAVGVVSIELAPA